MPIKQALKKELGDCIVERYRPESSCSLNLKNIRLNQRTIVDCDKYIELHRPDYKLCDYIIMLTLRTEAGELR